MRSSRCELRAEQRSNKVAGSAQFGRGRLGLGKASLALTFAVIVAVVVAARGNGKHWHESLLLPSTST